MTNKWYPFVSGITSPYWAINTEGQFWERLNQGHGENVIGKNVLIGKDVYIKVTEKLVIGKNTIIRDGCRITGRRVEIGRDSFLDYGSKIGLGREFKTNSAFRCGHWFHLGNNSVVNIAEPVHIGSDVAFGRNSSVFTHGIYLSMLDGFPYRFAPVTIGDRVWMAQGIIEPRVTIGSNTVILDGSVVRDDIPSGSLVAGVPAKVIKANVYPKQLTNNEKFDIIKWLFKEYNVDACYLARGILIFRVDEAIFDFENMTITGKVTPKSEYARDYCLRGGGGIKFKVEYDAPEYTPWVE